MASKPGILTEWPWKKLGNFKYLVLAPWVMHSCYNLFTTSNEEERRRDVSNFPIIPILLWRIIHNQIWISLARYKTAKGNSRILDKSIEFEQVDRERNWDDQIILSGLIMYLLTMHKVGAKHLPFWTNNGVVLTILLHMGPVEFLYYWLHRALHHHFLYSRYHSHHHSSIVTEPITSVIHPFAEILMYYALFAIPQLAMLLTETASLVAIAGYITYIDLMNNMGHCNFEIVPKRLFHLFPFLKYLMYTPSFHSLHHTQFRTNYCLFMPIYDYIYGTMDKSSDALYETSLKRQKETPHMVHLTHPTTLDSIYHLRLGFASLASGPYTSKWYLWMLWPMTWLFMLLTWVSNRTFVVESNMFNQLKMQTWAVPRFRFHYLLPWQKEAINKLIEEAILKAEKAGVKVLSLCLLNQEEELNGSGEVYIKKHPKLKIRVVDGSSLAVAVVLNSIPKGTKQVLLRGNLTKVAYSIASALCQNDVQVVTVRKDEFEKLRSRLSSNLKCNLILSASYAHQVWLVGDGLSNDEHKRAPKGTLFFPFSQFPITETRKDCVYHHTPAMITPRALENVHSCENWLPRRVMSAWRVAGVVHALEEWDDVHECGDTMFDIQKVWLASLKHGFLPLVVPT